MTLNKLTFIVMICLTVFGYDLSQAQDYYIYVASESEDEVSVVRFDGKKALVDKKIPVGVWPVEIEGPHGLTISPDGNFWFLSIAHGKPYGKVYKYATGTDELIGELELGFFPATMEISKATGLLYVVNFNLHGDHVPSSVSIVDPETMIELERVTTGIMPHGSRLSPDGLNHYSVAMMSNELYEIDAVTFELKRKLFVGDMPDMMSMGDMRLSGHAMPTYNPTWAIPHPFKDVVYVANYGTAEVIEVDLEQWEITRNFKTAPGPYNIAVSPDGNRMVVTYKIDGSTGVWDLNSGEELARITNSREVSHGIVISPDSRFGFASVEGKGSEPGSVDVIDLQAIKHVASADVGKQAGGIAFWKIANNH